MQLTTKRAGEVGDVVEAEAEENVGQGEVQEEPQATGTTGVGLALRRQMVPTTSKIVPSPKQK